MFFMKPATSLEEEKESGVFLEAGFVWLLNSAHIFPSL